MAQTLASCRPSLSSSSFVPRPRPRNDRRTNRGRGRGTKDEDENAGGRVYVVRRDRTACGPGSLTRRIGLIGFPRPFDLQARNRNPESFLTPESKSNPSQPSSLPNKTLSQVRQSFVIYSAGGIACLLCVHDVRAGCISECQGPCAK